MAALVEGRAVHFESEDLALAPRVEAFAGAFLLAALGRGVRLDLADAPSETWLRNARRLVALFRSWWGYAGPDPLDGVAARPDQGPPRAAAAQCFSGGIDSFYTLFRSAHRRDLVVFLHGFDIALEDGARMRAYAPSLRAVAAATGRRAAVVRTSVRHHPLLREVPWVRAHGAVLAALGHVLSDEVGSLVVPASWGRAWDAPWGSHWDADPLWSSDRLRVIHDDASLERWDKVPLIADEPLLFEHLRVCWENLDRAANCGRCEKCVRTRVVFARWGLAERGEAAFATRRPLVETLDRMEPLSREQRTWIWEPHYARWPLAPDLHDAVLRLVERSRRAEAPTAWPRVQRRLRRLARTLRFRAPRP